ncbi:MAG: GNAT family N-acetyltransferase [Ferrovibrio sp.]
MTARLLTPVDQPALERFLGRHAAEAMFLRFNLAQSGIVDGTQPYQGRYAAAFDGATIVGVAARYWNEFIVVCAPRHLKPLAPLLAGDRRPAGIIGPWQQALDMQEALGLDGAHHKMRSREVLMALSLADLKLPAPLLQGQDLQCRLATEEDQDLLTEWRQEFSYESLGDTPSLALAQKAAADVARWIAERSQFILTDGGRPVSGCCFNARLPDAVQVGNVWTPPQCRSRGYARAVVAGALDHARRQGATQGLLFTPEDHAAALTAYAAIGFTPVGDYAMVLFAD